MCVSETEKWQWEGLKVGAMKSICLEFFFIAFLKGYILHEGNSFNVQRNSAEGVAGFRTSNATSEGQESWLFALIAVHVF